MLAVLAHGYVIALEGTPKQNDFGLELRSAQDGGLMCNPCSLSGFQPVSK